jgi:hypothetical protein
MTNDFDTQIRFVAGAAWRLMEMQDKNPLSPSWGCFHYAYWRDKTSEFADARFQEAGPALALLSLPAFDAVRTEAGLPSPVVLRQAFSAALANWQAQQYPDGCFDEWYKGERGFAATEFTMIAYGLAARFLGDAMAAADRARLSETMARAGRWLARRHDRVKANHEAAAAAALALAWEVTGNEEFRRAARDKLDDTLARQRPEGWFPEVGGMDLGYCSVLLDYVMLHGLVTGDQTAVPAMRRLFAYMLPHLHPDGTITAESGLCLNPYVSRLGLGLLSAHDDDAAALVTTFRSSSPGIAGLRPTLADDLRLCRWSYLPLTTALLAERFRGIGEGPEAFAARLPQGWTHRAESAVAACHQGRLHVYFAPAGGGVVRIYDGRALLLEDDGLHMDDGTAKWASLGYDPDRPVEPVVGGFGMASALGPASFFYPSFLSRLVLRVGCIVPQLSYLLRAAIDFYRLRARTAVNQSAAPMAKGKSPYGYRRDVVVMDGTVRIRDRLECRGGSFDTARVVATARRRGEPLAVAMPAGSWPALEIEKTVGPGGEVEVAARTDGLAPPQSSR